MVGLKDLNYDYRNHYILNYINPALYIKMTLNKGRGVFTREDIKFGDILIIEKPVVRKCAKYDFTGKSKDEIENIYEKHSR